MTLDIAALRAGTPGCTDHVHFNHAGSSLMPQRVVDRVTAHWQKEARQGGMEAGAAVADALEDVRGSAARLFGCDATEIAFTTGASAGYGKAVAALARWRPGDRILVSRQEWGGNLATLHMAAARTGAQLECLPCTADGSVDVARIPALLDERVRLVCTTWVPANGGLVNPVAQIGAVIRPHGIAFLVDAAQAAGQMPMDVDSLGCDLLVANGRKYLRGPRGTGLLYVRRAWLDALEPAYADTWSAPWNGSAHAWCADARRLEDSEQNIAALLGLGEALSLALSIGVDVIRERIDALAQSLRQRLSAVGGVLVRDLGQVRAGLVSFTVEGWTAGQVRQQLAAQGIVVGANGVAYTPLDMQARGLVEIVRASVTYFTADDEVDQLVAAVAAMAERSCEA
ncbi:aminotransferase class V-fold PLP-dependent enzyme [Tahibacter amnicola]|uniref:Aminotransferase class V-fold PLP-dependent enzyme n=1 Tax=Tahibacter amnicola TaxID=2976241 RepID=A0ABY6BNK3_9GAMM|nr:aminotransferase class V-fold PLP-dependent enzyme [Tahibacter amnicola]UXI69970.1 aminotransferase class V-fold PLP-dependent enzyme [Tahibacter amnicola]